MPIDYSVLADPKPEPRKRTKRRKQRHERAVKQDVRAQCVERDGSCRALHVFADRDYWEGDFVTCAGPSHWAHLAGHRRSQTRGQAPTARHTAAHSLILCCRHHGMEERGELTVTYLTDRGCDGPIRFSVAKRRTG